MRTLSVLGCVLVPALLWAAPAAPDKDDRAANPVEKVRKDLDKLVTLKIDKQPLSTAVDMLREKTKLNIVLDSVTIQQQLGFTPDQPPSPVTVDLKDASARTALRAVVGTYGLSYAVIGDTIVVTTEDMAMLRQMRQRVSVDLDKVELAAALRQIGRATATNLILDSRVDKETKTAVSLQIEDVPLETAVRLLSEMAGLKPVRVGNTLFVTKKETANEMRNDPDFTQPNQPVVGTTYAVPAGQNFIIGNVAVPAPAPFGPAPNPPGTVPPAVGPATTPPMSGTGSAPTAAAAPQDKKVIDEDAPANGAKPTAPEAVPEKKDIPK